MLGLAAPIVVRKKAKEVCEVCNEINIRLDANDESVSLQSVGPPVDIQPGKWEGGEMRAFHFNERNEAVIQFVEDSLCNAGVLKPCSSLRGLEKVTDLVIVVSKKILGRVYPAPPHVRSMVFD